MHFNCHECTVRISLLMLRTPSFDSGTCCTSGSRLAEATTRKLVLFPTPSVALSSWLLPKPAPHGPPSHLTTKPVATKCITTCHNASQRVTTHHNPQPINQTQKGGGMTCLSRTALSSVFPVVTSSSSTKVTMTNIPPPAALRGGWAIVPW